MRERPAVVARGLGKAYRRWGRTRAFGTLKSALLGHGLAEVLNPSETVPALCDVSFEVRKGETFGVVGPNGCGKSTLLKLVAGILKPTSGSIEVDGKVSALIELGAGFHPEISGRENVVINGVMLGLTRKEIERKLPAIVEFSGLGDFLDQPVKTYSSGMYVRLGFAVAIHVDPDVLVVDEVLAVGDEAFAHRCLDAIRERAARGTTIFFVTHSLSLVEELCDRALYLDSGSVRATGEPREVLSRYRLDVASREGTRLMAEHEADQERRRQEAPSAPPPEAAPGSESADEAADALRAVGEAGPSGAAPEPGPALPPAERPRRWGDGSVAITACRLLDGAGEERYAFRSGEALSVEVELTPRRPLTDFVLGVGLFTPEEACVLGTNTEVEGFVPERLDAEARFRLSLPRCELGAGTYLLDVAVHARRGTPYDYWRGACRFRVDAPTAEAGTWRPERRWDFSGGIVWKAAP